jgi:hypothetical protein
MRYLKILIIQGLVFSLTTAQASGYRCSDGKLAFKELQKEQYTVTLESTKPKFKDFKGKSYFDIKKQHDQALAKLLALKGLRAMNQSFKDDLESILNGETGEKASTRTAAEDKKYQALMNTEEIDGIKGGVYGFEDHYGESAAAKKVDQMLAGKTKEEWEAANTPKKFDEEVKKLFGADEKNIDFIIAEALSKEKTFETLYDLESSIRDKNLAGSDEEGDQGRGTIMADSSQFAKRGLPHFQRGFLGKSTDAIHAPLKEYSGMFAYLKVDPAKLPAILKDGGAFAEKFNKLKKITAPGATAATIGGDTTEATSLLLAAYNDLNTKSSASFGKYRERLAKALPINQRQRVRDYVAGVGALDRAVKTSKSIATIQTFLNRAQKVLKINSTDFEGSKDLGADVVARMQKECSGKLKPFYASVKGFVDSKTSEIAKISEDDEDAVEKRRLAGNNLKTNIDSAMSGSDGEAIQVCLYMDKKDPAADKLSKDIKAINGSIDFPSSSDGTGVSANLQSFVNLARVSAGSDAAAYQAQLETFEKTLTADLPDALVNAVAETEKKTIADLTAANTTLQDQFKSYDRCLREKIAGGSKICRDKLQPSGHKALAKYKELQGKILGSAAPDAKAIASFDPSKLAGLSRDALSKGQDLYKYHFNPNRGELIDLSDRKEILAKKVKEEIEKIKASTKYNSKSDSTIESMFGKLGEGGDSDEAQKNMALMAQTLCESLGNDIKDASDPAKKMSCDFATTLFKDGEIDSDKLEDLAALMNVDNSAMKAKMDAVYDEHKKKVENMQAVMAELQKQDSYKNLERIKYLAAKNIENNCSFGDENKEYGWCNVGSTQSPVLKLLGAADQIIGEIDPSIKKDMAESKALQSKCFQLYNKSGNTALEGLCNAMRRGEVAAPTSNKTANNTPVLSRFSKKEQALAVEANTNIDNGAYWDRSSKSMKTVDEDDLDFVANGFIDAAPYLFGTMGTAFSAYNTANQASLSVFGINQRVDQFNLLNSGQFFLPTGFQNPIFGGTFNYSLGGGGFNFI